MLFDGGSQTKQVRDQFSEAGWIYCNAAYSLAHSDVKQRREGSRAKQIERANKGLRKPDVFKPGDTVYLRDQQGKWIKSLNILVTAFP